MTFRTSTAPSGPVVTPTEVTFRFPDPDPRLAGVRLAQQVRVPGDRLDFTRRGGTWQLTLPRPPVWRMEYRLRAAAPGRRRRGGLRPGQPAAGAGRVRGQVGAGVRRLPAAGLAGRAGAARPGDRAAGALALPAGRGRGQALGPGGRRADRAAAAPGRARRPGVRRAVRPDHVRVGADRGRAAAPAPGRAAGPRRPGRVVQRERQLREGAGAGRAAGDPAPVRGHRAGGRDGRQPGRAGRAARPAPAPGPVRRAVPAVRLVLHPPARPAGERLRPVLRGSPGSSARPAAAPSRPSRCRRR